MSECEAAATSRRLWQIEAKPMTGVVDTARLQAIHRHVFQDVYDWAGEFRTVNLSRGGQFPFAFVQQIVPSLGILFGRLGAEHGLRGMPSTEFCRRAAYYLGELNAIHPFREGNGRAQRELIRQLALSNGHAINWTRVSREEMTEASKLSFQRADNSGLERVLRDALDPEGILGHDRE